MVTVGDVDHLHGVEGGRHGIDLGGIIDHPERMARTGQLDSIGGVARRHPLRHLGQGGSGRVGGEDGAGLGRHRLDLADPVVLLVRPGELVAPNAICVIGGDRAAGDDAGLKMVAHFDAINVVAGRAVAPQDAVTNQPCHVLRPLGIDLRREGVGAGGQVDFRL